MSFTRVSRILIATALGLAATLHAERVFPVKGIVRAAYADGRIVVAHEDIAGLMPAMTMGFDVPAASAPDAQRLQPGDRVEFSLHVGDTETVADGFRVVGHVRAEPPRTAPAPAVRRLHEGDVVPGFNLIDEANRPFTAAQFADHVTLLTFVFTRCPVPEFCPLVSRRFAELQKAIGSDPALRDRSRLLSITLDPEFDRPEVLAAYGKAVGADPAIWRFATGETSQVTALVKAFSVYTERNGAALDHTLCTALISSDGRILSLWRGNAWTTAEVLQSLRAGK